MMSNQINSTCLSTLQSGNVNMIFGGARRLEHVRCFKAFISGLI